jgi:hypothetical protein
MTDARTDPGTQRTQRLAAMAVLLVLGVLSLPLAAAVFDGQDTENYILPAQLLGMAVLGGVVGYLLPGLGGATSRRNRSMWVGVALGLVFALLGLAVFFLLLNGFDGA